MSLFTCFGIFRPTLEFFTRTETSPLPVKGFLYSALMAIEHWGFFRMPNQLWHGASIYNGHFRGPATLTSVAERFAVELLLPIFTLWACHGWDWNTKPSSCEANALTDWSTPAVFTTSFHLNNLKKSEFPTSRMLRVKFFWNEIRVCGSR